MMSLFTLHIFDPDPRYGGWFDMYLRIWAADIQSAAAVASQQWGPVFRMVEQ